MMMKNFFLLALTSFFLTATAQDNFGPVFTKINTEVQSNSKAYSTLKDASLTVGHRLTGSVNGAKAEEYAYNLLVTPRIIEAINFTKIEKFERKNNFKSIGRILYRSRRLWINSWAGCRY